MYLDFMKAFDKVPHHRLLKKLNCYGISGNIVNWIQSFLLNRRQRVRVMNSYSEWTPVTSGIPQGSVLGPILFVIYFMNYINDLPDSIQSNCYMFADDIPFLVGSPERLKATHWQPRYALRESLQSLFASTLEHS